MDMQDSSTNGVPCDKNQSRIVRHFHFKTWEDKGKPQYGPHTLLAFMNRIHSLDKHGHGPLIVHCSAGVGRTGSFIALDILQQMATKQQSVDIYNCVDRLRRERMFMVQTKEQYVFLHQTIVEFIKYTNTSHDCNRFSQKFASVLDQQADPEIMSIMEVELKHLTEQNPNTRSDNKSGLKEENKDKNRNLELVPDDSKRLFISGIVGNYINAISSDSFAAHNSRVVTQMPLPQTMADFWKLIMGENCRGIIMLNQLDNTDPTCIPYWPKEINGKKTYGQIKVELLATDEDTKSGFIVKRDFRVTEIKQREFGPANTMTVRQFQLISWPNDQILPPQRKHLLDLMDHLQSWQQSSKDSAEKGKVLVHCIDGGSRSGIFCGVSFMLDRMRIEQDVNVYLSARYVSRNRPQFFDNILEYQFLYQMAVEHLTESKEYANVR
ncbi:hypothetical protein LSH36_286g02007 [Paralvinella palmiformis]|uniref:protein-tyrosine-phosphatase n=1 Tax=Paralvinella palmiformis TaxID=53620 RepID=A0AAD9N375_9ANNE|nr:hypothetical protein LSH36_286g02007 [Paralvinella palmiformis]